MPIRGGRQCNQPGCSNVQNAAYCDEHRKTVDKRAEERRESSTKRGYGRAWRKARKAYLNEHPLCVYCSAKGLVVAATVVDHVIKHRGDQGLFWDRLNWQSLCKDCHDEKTGRGE